MLEESLSHAVAEQALAVGAEGRVVPDGFVDVHADEPAVKRVVFDVLDQLPFGADREQGLDQAGPEQPFRRSRRAAPARIQRLEFGTHALQNAVDQDAQLAQRVRRRDALLQRPVAERGVLGVVGLADGIK